MNGREEAVCATPTKQTTCSDFVKSTSDNLETALNIANDIESFLLGNVNAEKEQQNLPVACMMSAVEKNALLSADLHRVLVRIKEKL